MAVKGIAFDIDGTLYPNWQMFFLSIPSFLKSPRLVLHYSRMRKAIRKIDVIEDFRQLQAKMIAESMKTDAEKVKKIEKNLYSSWEADFRHLKPYPHLKPLLEELKGRGDVKLGVLSDFPVQNKLAFMGLDGYWDAALSSEEVHYLKPRKEPFLALADRMGVLPEEILYVGNNPRYDVGGAKQVGMTTALLGRHADTNGADFVFTDYRRLREYILSLL